MVQDIVADSGFLIQNVGIKFREDSGVRGTQILNQCPRKMEGRIFQNVHLKDPLLEELGFNYDS